MNNIKLNNALTTTHTHNARAAASSSENKTRDTHLHGLFESLRVRTWKILLCFFFVQSNTDAMQYMGMSRQALCLVPC